MVASFWRRFKHRYIWSRVEGMKNTAVSRDPFPIWLTMNDTWEYFKENITQVRFTGDENVQLKNFQTMLVEFYSLK